MEFQTEKQIDPPVYIFLDSSAIRRDAKEDIGHMEGVANVLPNRVVLFLITVDQSRDVFNRHSVLQTKVPFSILTRTIETNQMKSVSVDLAKPVDLVRMLE